MRQMKLGHSQVLISELPNEVQLSVVPPRSVLGVFVSSLGVLLWFLAAVQVSRFVFPLPKLETIGLGDILILGFIAIGIFIGVNVFYALMFELFGTERLRIVDGELHLSRGVPGCVHSRRFDIGRVENPRVLDLSRGPFVRGLAFGGSRNGSVGFDYEGRLVRFGDNLAAPQAVIAAQFLRRHLSRESA
jgi:hypothetical protein